MPGPSLPLTSDSCEGRGPKGARFLAFLRDTIQFSVQYPTSLTLTSNLNILKKTQTTVWVGQAKFSG